MAAIVACSQLEAGMQNNRIRSNKGIFVVMAITILALVLLLVGFWVRAAYREAQIAANLTPELVVRAFQDAGYRVINVRETDEHPGPMGIPEYGIRFDIYVNNTVFDVLVVAYDEQERAQRSAIAVNDLDRRMNGGYSYAFYRGVVLVQIFPSDKGVGRELNAVLKTIE